MKNFLKGSLTLAAVVLVAGQAGAITINSSVGGNAWAGQNYLTFDEVIPANVVLTPDAQALTGNIGGVAAAPFLTGNNNLYFGSVYTGADNTRYITTGKFPTGKIEFNFASTQTYFGLLWGSVDRYNNLEFLLDGERVALLTGVDALSPANGYQGDGGSTYVNISGIAFNQVVATSRDAYAFELDNVAYGVGVPDGGTTIALLGFAVVGLAGLRRKLSM